MKRNLYKYSIVLLLALIVLSAKVQAASLHCTPKNWLFHSVEIQLDWSNQSAVNYSYSSNGDLVAQGISSFYKTSGSVGGFTVESTYSLNFENSKGRVNINGYEEYFFSASPVNDQLSGNVVAQDGTSIDIKCDVTR